MWNQESTPESRQKAGSFITEAIQADPAYAPAYAALAEHKFIEGQFTSDRLDELFRLARLYAAKALELDPALPEGHLSAALIALFYDRDWAVAGQEFQSALELDPNLVRARAMYCVYLLAIGNIDEALRQNALAQAMDPLSLALRNQVARTFYFARRYDLAIAECRKKLDLDHSAVSPIGLLALIYDAQGRYEEALALERKALTTPSSPEKHRHAGAYPGDVRRFQGSPPPGAAARDTLPQGVRCLVFDSDRLRRPGAEKRKRWKAWKRLTRFTTRF